MSNTPSTDQPANSAASIHSPSAKKLSMVDIAMQNLGAQRSDLVQLLLAINTRSPSRQQVPGLLKNAYRRLVSARKLLDDIAQTTISDQGLNDRYEAAKIALQPSEEISLEQAQQICQQLADSCSNKNQDANLVAQCYELHGLISACRQHYSEAAKSFSNAASVSELPSQMRWQYLMQQALTLTDLGKEYGENQPLEEAIDLLKNQILLLVPEESQTEDWATSQQELGNVQGILGQRQGGTRNLDNAIASLQASLTKRNRQEQPLKWAEAQNSLGTALGILAHRHNDGEMLGQSICAFENALEERRQDIAPWEWAISLNNLASVLQSLGQRNKDSKMLKRSVEAYKEVLQQWTREKAPLDWATTMNNMGTALRLLGEQRSGPRTLEQSIAAYNSALTERSRELFPQEWAMIQNNLGAALQKLAERIEDPSTLQKAMDAYENALKEWTEKRVPMAWAMTLANLAVARRTFAEATDDLESASKAVEELEAVADAFRHASHAQYSELSIDQLGQARKLMNTLALKEPAE